VFEILCPEKGSAVFCQKCGTELPEDAAFCLKCGAEVHPQVFRSGQVANAARDEHRIDKKPDWPLRAAGIFILVLIAVAVIVAVKEKEDQRKIAAYFADKSRQFANSRSSPAPTPYWTTGSYKIESQATALAPGHYWYQPIDVNEHWRNARLVGKFTAQGGRGNDVNAFVTNDDGLMNFRNGHRFNQWYESGRVTVDTINARLPAGRSYFVLSNTFSTFAHKSVAFDLRVEYEHLVQP